MKRNSFTAICIRVIALVAGLWLLCMALFTLGLANTFYTQFMSFGNTYSTFYNPSRYYYGNADSALPGYAESKILFFLGVKNMDEIPVDFFRPDHPFDPLTREGFDYDRAVVILDEAGNVEMCSGNYLFFNYMTQEQWDAQTTTNADHAGFAYVALSKEELPKYRVLQDKYGAGDDESWMLGRLWMFDEMALRFQGYFENNRFYPVVMELSVFDYENPTFLPVSARTLPHWEAEGYLHWDILFDDRESNTPPLTTIYVTDPDMILYDEGEHIDSTLGSYDSLLALLTDRVAQKQYGRDESFFAPIAISVGQMGERTVCTAVTCNPVWEAVKAMRYVYLATFLFLVLGLFFLLRSVKRNLTRPLSLVNDGFRFDATKLPEKHITRWQDVRDLEDQFEETSRELAEEKAENQRLNAALDFAKEAEEKRRKLISGLTHELKTPLAVIHSYAEGLQSGIAEEKKEKYLGVILEETEKMDALVLDMLDYSRLDAGKTRLNLESFSLLQLVQSVQERLGLKAEEKGLSIRYNVAEEFTLTADEARMDQVITNFLTNAIKYTPENGEIILSVYRNGKEASFAIENTCQPLSKEALEHIWDSFYQADPSHRTQGSGLGLALVHRIVTLHRGSCYVTNSPTGVLFRIRLPIG